jgi:hypothetical protein
MSDLAFKVLPRVEVAALAVDKMLATEAPVALPLIVVPSNNVSPVATLLKVMLQGLQLLTFCQLLVLQLLL